MTLLHCGFLPYNPLSNVFPTNPSFNKLNNSPPKFECRATTARNVGSQAIRESKQVNPQTQLTAIAGNASNSNHRIENKDEIDECLYLLHRCNIDRTHTYECRQIHARVVKLGLFGSNCLIGNRLVILYSKNLSLLDDARRLFDEIPERTVEGYAALIGSYRRSQRWEDLVFLLGLMVHEGVQPDKFLVPTILKACSALEILKIGKMVHGYVLRKEMESDVFVGNALIDMYAKCGDLGTSRRVFDTMLERDVVSWTALFSAYMDAGLLDEARDIFESMRLDGVNPDIISWNALVSGFARNGETDMALQLVEEMRENGLKPGVSSWNGIISGCVQNGYFEDALDVFSKMLWLSEDPNAVTIASVLPACAGLRDMDFGKRVHAFSLKRDIWGNIFVEGSLIDMYSKCGRNEYAEKVFVEIENKNTAVWNEMIAAYVNEGKMRESVELLYSMQSDGLKPDVITYNTMLAGYARKGQKNEAFELLSEMVRKRLLPNIVSLNALISGFQQSGLSGDALKLFRVMQSPSNIINIDTDGSKANSGFPTEVLNVSIQPNSVTITGALAACADLYSRRQGKEIHGYILRNGFKPNIFITSALVDMYAKCYDMDSATKTFWRIEDRNTVSWNILMAGHSNNGQPHKALKLFQEMLGDGLEPSSITLMILLLSCSDIAALRLGRELHTYILKSGFDESNVSLASALVSMYAKCGSILEARHVFDSVVEKDVALWNAMISGHSIHGMAKDAIALFGQLESSGIDPDHITFTALLSACTHEGLVEEGWKYFNNMEDFYGIKPTLEHYTCMVGIMGGAGLLEEALDFMGRMPYAPDACMWATLLRACRVHSNPEIGERAANALFELEPSNASNYIVLSNIYAMAGMWDSARNLRSVMKGRGLMIIKECSFIDVDTTIYAFKGGDNSHPELEEILEMWDKVAIEMERAGFLPLDPVFGDEDELDIFSCLHSEKLAICFGIISSNAHRPIRISKNIRMCIDCHTSAKHISEIDEREIFVKDGCFYHHFKDGICSCQDKW
ncbi:hypothetical protein HHK36_009071 [Tetracentron sinense]|uniref:DYW domain-containing protein n=1 Tax=Tetracentron sinense TaxID=13715 RepID=A0A834ZB41_TETSI|nr:hypothetical protein HHK36_009071 [Tetracentron sinense]